MALRSSQSITVGPLEMDMPGRCVRVYGAEVHLTAREPDLLAVLAEHEPTVLSRAPLLELVWGYDMAADTASGPATTSNSDRDTRTLHVGVLQRTRMNDHVRDERKSA
jgi:hypothetical protein